MTTIVRPLGTTPPPAQAGRVVAYDVTKDHKLRPVPAAEAATSKDPILRRTVANASEVMTFLHDRLGRDGIDGRGSKLNIVVHVPDVIGGDVNAPMSNAFWDGRSKRIYVGDGDGTLFAPFGYSKDIIAHEVGHAILESEVNLQHEGQGGALHESFGDVLGALVDPEDWQIGEDSFTPRRPGDAMRDMSRPVKFQHMRQVPGGTAEVHDLADIPNLAAYRAAEQIGRDAMGKVWYEGFTNHLKDGAVFADAAAATVEAAQKLFGRDSSQAGAVADAWKSVGVLGRGDAPSGAALRPMGW